MNSERLPGQLGEGAANASSQRRVSRDQVEYRGPLKDPSKRPAEEEVRPPPELDIQADSEEGWEIREEELTTEHIRRLGHYLYVSMFYDRTPEVTTNLYRTHDQAVASVSEGWMAETEPIHWPAETFVEAFAVRYGMNLPLLHRFCEAASREIAELLLPTLHAKRSGITTHWSDRLTDLHDDVDAREGRTTSKERLEWTIATTERVGQNGLRATIDDHTTMLRKAESYGIALSAPLPPSGSAT